MKIKDKKAIIFKATDLRLLLVLIIVVGSLAVIIGFYIVQDKLKNQPNPSSNHNLSNQANLLKEDMSNLGDKKTLIIGSVYNKNNYQQKFKEDIERLASLSNIKIQNISFTNNIPELIDGQKANVSIFNEVATINIDNLASVENYLRFLKLVENNSPVLIVQSIGLNKLDGSNMIKIEPLKIGLLIRHE